MRSFPRVGNVYGDRLGKLAVHGRYARFDPVATEASTAGWDFHDWKAGDGAAVAARPDGHRPHPRLRHEPRRGQGHQPRLARHRSASPTTTSPARSSRTPTSISNWGIRPWSAENLIVKQGVTESQHRRSRKPSCTPSTSSTATPARTTGSARSRSGRNASAPPEPRPTGCSCRRSTSTTGSPSRSAARAAAGSPTTGSPAPQQVLRRRCARDLPARRARPR